MNDQTLRRDCNVLPFRSILDLILVAERTTKLKLLAKTEVVSHGRIQSLVPSATEKLLLKTEKTRLRKLYLRSKKSKLARFQLELTRKLIATMAYRFYGEW
jgi:hypothetical protein